MTVYVDDMYRSSIGQYGRMKMSHMLSDDEAEIHAMAAKIGVDRRWYQGDHYDIALSKRALAILFGAVEITWRQAGIMSAIRRYTGKLGNPSTCMEDYRNLKEIRRAKSVS